MGLGRVVVLVFLIIYAAQAQKDADDADDDGSFGGYTAQLQDARIRKVFNVLEYGASTSPTTDNTKAFLRTWDDVCKWSGKSRFLVPLGTFIISPVTFRGPCKGQVNFRVEGVIQAHPDLVHNEKWITFQYLNRFVLNGRGVFDGQGNMGWFHNTCDRDANCRPLPVNIGFDFVTTSRVHRITSLNSKNTHINLFGCYDFNITKVKIIAPDESPNTDGIRMGKSSRIGLSRLLIGTGDDCISMLGGSQDIHISDVLCGPGHGISVGSLGKYQGESNVRGITVQRSTFVGTTNGVRIKTWAASESSSVASNMLFEDLEMRNVANPIIIDQQYCPYPPCYQETPTQVQISDITFRNIWGTSSTKNAVFFRCSQRQPCRNVQMQDISLAYKGREGGPSTAACYNINGRTTGRQNPPPCL